MSKKLLTKLLALTMCAGLILQPVTAFAQEEPEALFLEEDSEDDIPPIELPEIQNVKLHGDMLTWDHDPNTDCYLVEVGSNGDVYDNSCDLRKFCEMFGYGYGIYSVRVVGMDMDMNFTTKEYNFEYDYGKQSDIPEPPIIDPPSKVMWLSAIEAVSNLEFLKQYKSHNFPRVTSLSSYAWIESTWEFFGPEGWVDIGVAGESALEAGTYRIKATISPNFPEVRFESTLTLTVDGEEWDLLGDIGDTASFVSPEFEIAADAPELPKIEDAKVEYDELSWKASPEVDCYVVELVTGFVYSCADDNITSPYNLKEFCEYYEFDYGTYHGRLYGTDKSSFEQTTRVFEFDYIYRPQALIGIIDSVSGTSNFDQIVADGIYRFPTFTSQTEDVEISNMYYQVKVSDDDFRTTGFGEDQPFAPGTYRLQINVSIDPKYLSDLIFDDTGVELFIDGKPWTYGEVLGRTSIGIASIIFHSPEFTIKEDEPNEPIDPIDPIDPQDPENITGGTWTSKWGATYYVTEDGEKLTGMNKVEGDYYLFSKKGTMQKSTFYEEDGKKYYFGSDGKAITGWLKKWTATYYFEDDFTMKTGFADIDGDTYYFNAKGHLVKSKWIEEEGNKYYAKADGKLAKNETIKKWGKKYSFDADGVLLP